MSSVMNHECPMKSAKNGGESGDVIEESAGLPLPPGSFGLPLLGETLEFIKSPRAFVESRRRRYGNVFRSRILGDPTVFMMGSDAMQWIFASERAGTLQRRWAYTFRRVFGAESVAMLDGGAHQERRQLLNTTFSVAAMHDLVPIIEATAARYLDRWADRGGVITLAAEFQKLVFELALVLIFREEYADIDIDHMSRLFAAWKAGHFSPIPLDLPMTTFGRALAARRALIEAIEPIVIARQRRSEQTSDVLGSLLSARDGAGRPLSHSAISDEILLQLFAGHETIVTVISNMMLLLAVHPDVLRRCREEQRAVAAGDGLTLDHIKAMLYLHQTVNEVFRFITPVNLSFRGVVRDVSYDGYRIPSGWSVALGFDGTHHAPSSWSTPEHFDPERFGPDRAEHKKEPCKFLPFGGGPRVCPGRHFAMAEIPIIMSLLLRHYRWELAVDQDLTIAPLPAPMPKSGIKVHFSRL